MKKVFTISVAVIAAIAVLWFFPLLRSVSVMSVYSAIHEKTGIMKDSGLNVDIPGGNVTAERDWYPFPMTFNTSGFTEDARMTIIYNFPAFNLFTRTSSLYDQSSPFYSAFYGAYIIKTDDTQPYGFKEGLIHEEEILTAFRYDYVELVLKSFAAGDFKFTPLEISARETEYLGIEDWIRLDARILTNGASHNKNGFRQSYLQYGNPSITETGNFPELTMYGRLYIRYFNEYGCTVAIYVMAPGKSVVDTCDQKILSHSSIH